MYKKVYDQIFLQKSFISITIKKIAIAKKKQPKKAIAIWLSTGMSQVFATWIENQPNAIERIICAI